MLFETPGPVALGCNIHDRMVSHVYVVDSPWFTKTDKAGDARLAFQIDIMIPKPVKATQ